MDRYILYITIEKDFEPKLSSKICVVVVCIKQTVICQNQYGQTTDFKLK